MIEDEKDLFILFFPSIIIIHILDREAYPSTFSMNPQSQCLEGHEGGETQAV